MHFLVAGRGSVAVASVAFGVTFNGLLLYWIRLFGPAPYVGLTIVQTLWIVLALQVGLLLRDRVPPKLRFLVFPLVYLLQEFFRSQVPWGGFSWGGLGYTQHDNLFVLKLAAYTGVWGLSLGLGVMNSLFAESLLRWRRDPAWALKAGGAIVAIATLPGLLPVTSPGGNEAKIAMVQGNVPEDSIDPLDDDEEVIENHVRLTEGLRGEDFDLVIWPESSFDQDPFRRPDFERPLVDAVTGAGTHFVVGAILGDRREGGIRNSSLFFNPDGELEDVYTKRRLVPFGEWVPLRSFLQPLVPDLNRIPVDQVPGTESTVFELPSGTFASVICYESTYPDLVRDFVQSGARMIVVSANFAAYERSFASAQHIAFSQLRAAEQRMWVAHTSISGISAVVDPEGRVLEQTGLFEPAVLTPTVRFATSITPYARFGDWVPNGAVLVVVGLLVGSLLPGRRGRNAEEEGSAGASG